MKYNKISTIIEDVMDLEGFIESSDISTMKKLAHSKLNKIMPPTSYIVKIKLLDLKDGKVRLPEYEKIVQLAYKYEKENIPEIKVKWVENLYKPEVESICTKCGKTLNDCNCKTPEVTFNVGNWELPEYVYAKMSVLYGDNTLTRNGIYRSSIIPEFVLMKPSTHEFFFADRYVPGCLNLSEKLMVNNNVEYNIENGYLYVNKKRGKVLIAYFTLRLDEEGYRMIPEIEDVYSTLKWYIIEVMAYRNMNKAVTPQEKKFYRDKYLMAEQRRMQYEIAAIETLNTPNFKEWLDFLEQYYFQIVNDPTKLDYFGVKSPDIYGGIMNKLTRYE